MSHYHIQQRLSTLSENALFSKGMENPEFEIDGITFRQWDFSHGYGWKGYAWILDFDTDARTANDAYREFHSKLSRIVPAIALISQSYTSHNAQPFLIERSGTKTAFFRYVREDDPVGLMFDEKNKKALDILLRNTTIPDDFYSFWNDAVNAVGLASKVLLMCTAILALTKKNNGDNDYTKIESILGQELKDQLFARYTGLRHRLSHGEYLNDDDTGNNYVEKIHKKIVQWFNAQIFNEELITEDVVDPQRNFINHSVGSFFIVNDEEGSLKLKDVVDEFDSHPNELNKVKYKFDFEEDASKF